MMNALRFVGYAARGGYYRVVQLVFSDDAEHLLYTYVSLLLICPVDMGLSVSRRIHLFLPLLHCPDGIHETPRFEASQGLETTTSLDSCGTCPRGSCRQHRCVPASQSPLLIHALILSPGSRIFLTHVESMYRCSLCCQRRWHANTSNSTTTSTATGTMTATTTTISTIVD